MQNVDKILHFIVGALFVLVGTLLKVPIFLSVIIASVIGALKEVYDALHRSKHTPDGNDFLATVLGSLFGAIVYMGIIS